MHCHVGMMVALVKYGMVSVMYCWYDHGMEENQAGCHVDTCTEPGSSLYLFSHVCQFGFVLLFYLQPVFELQSVRRREGVHFILLTPR